MTPHIDQQAGITAFAAEGDAALRRLLAERACKLAQPLVRSLHDAEQRQALIVACEDERIAIDSRYVLEVFPAERVIPVPGAASYWRGLVNLRGRLYPVLELSSFLAQLHLHAPAGMTKGDGRRLVLAQAANLTMALYVDEVQEVRRFTEGALLPPVANALKAEETLVLGMTEDMVVLLDLNVLFQNDCLSAQVTTV